MNVVFLLKSPKSSCTQFLTECRCWFTVMKTAVVPALGVVLPLVWPTETVEKVESQ